MVYSTQATVEKFTQLKTHFQYDATSVTVNATILLAENNFLNDLTTTTVSAQNIVDEMGDTVGTPAALTLVNVESLIDNAVSYINSQTGIGMAYMAGSAGSKTCTCSKTQADILKALAKIYTRGLKKTGSVSGSIGSFSFNSSASDPNQKVLEDIVKAGLPRLQTLGLVNTEYHIDNAIYYINLNSGSSITALSGTAGSKTTTMTGSEAALVKLLASNLLKASLSRGAPQGITPVNLLSEPANASLNAMITAGIGQLRIMAANEGVTFDWAAFVAQQQTTADNLIDSYCGVPSGFFVAGGYGVTNEYHDGGEIQRSGDSTDPTSVICKMFLHPVISVTTFSEETTTGVWTARAENTDFIVVPEGVRFILSASVPNASKYRNVKVTYTAGYSAIPTAVATVSARLAAALIEAIAQGKPGTEVFTAELKAELEQYVMKPRFSSTWALTAGNIPTDTRFINDFDYIIYLNGVNYEAINGVTGTVSYGGAADVGGVDGADAAAVIQAAMDALTPDVNSGGTVVLCADTDYGAVGDACNLTVPYNINLVGLDQRSTIIYGTISFDAVKYPRFAAPSRIEHMTVAAKTAVQNYGFNYSGDVQAVTVNDVHAGGVLADFYLNGTDMFKCVWQNISTDYGGTYGWYVTGFIDDCTFDNILSGDQDYCFYMTINGVMSLSKMTRFTTARPNVQGFCCLGAVYGCTFLTCTFGDLFDCSDTDVMEFNASGALSAMASRNNTFVNCLFNCFQTAGGTLHIAKYKATAFRDCCINENLQIDADCDTLTFDNIDDLGQGLTITDGAADTTFRGPQFEFDFYVTMNTAAASGFQLIPVPATYDNKAFYSITFTPLESPAAGTQHITKYGIALAYQTRKTPINTASFAYLYQDDATAREVIMLVHLNAV